MLAVQNPMMHSAQRQQRPIGALPFGYEAEDMAGSSHVPLSYELYGTDAFLAEPPPAPAPGDPLLTEIQTVNLNNVIADMAFGNNYGEHTLGEGLNTSDWLGTDMPPAPLFSVGTSYGIPQQTSDLSAANSYHNTQSPIFSTANPSTSAFKLPPTAPVSFPSTSSLMSPATSISTVLPTSYVPPSAIPHACIPQHGDQQLTLEPDALQGAVLLQNGAHHRSHNMQIDPGFSNDSHHRSNNSMGPPVGHLRHQPLNEFKQDGRRISQSQPNETWRNMYILDNGIQSAPRTAQPVPQVLQYGTDHQFNGNNQPFVPQNKKESLESMESQQQRYMKAVELCPISNTTHPTSPVFDPSAFNLKTRGPPKPLEIEPNEHDGLRSCKNWDTSLEAVKEEEEPQSEPQSAISTGSARKRKFKTRSGSIASPGADEAALGPGKRRKSSTAVRRDNLTEDQKRNNHIKSEQKRRKVIQVGFANLGVIVPGLGLSGNPSKSAMLECTVTFLQKLLDGNRSIQAQAELLS